MTSRKGEENRFKGKFLSDTTLSGNEYSPDRVKKKCKKETTYYNFPVLEFLAPVSFDQIVSTRFTKDLERDEKITERSIRF